MKKFSWWDFAALIIWVLPIIYVLKIYSGLATTVPLHYGFDGKPDRYGNKEELLITLLAIPAISAFVYLLLKFLPFIDPKKKVNYGEPTFKKLGFGLVVFMSITCLFITFAAIDKTFNISKFMMPVLGLFFVFLGNFMHSIKPNYFAGVRTPWTLEDEGNWRATHRLTGKLWVGGGIIITIAMLLLPEQNRGYTLAACIFIMVMIPVIYSYIYFKKNGVK